MRINKCLSRALLSLILIAPCVTRAQESSINTFSPYTMYGLGNIGGGANTAFAGMGGASIGFRNGGFDTAAETRLNLSNPAAMSAIAPRTFVFDVGLAGSNVYLMERSAENGTLRSSFNTFNINNITIAFPLAKRLGMAFNISPFSQVGYRVQLDDLSHGADPGVVRYFYDGQGDVNEAKASVGWEPFKGLSVGAEAIYMWGNIDRTYRAEINAYTGTGAYNDVNASTNEKVSRAFGAFGLQYTPLDKPKARLTIGATYRMSGKLNSKVTDHIPSNNIYGDDVRLEEFRSPLRMPQMIGAGVYFHKLKWAVGADYVYQDWGSKNNFELSPGIGYANTNAYKLGVQYTPNRFDIRGRFASFWNRVTYKAGVRYNDHYIMFGGRKLNEKAVSIGLDIPFQAMSVSMVSVGLEYGERGALRQGLVKERFFKINVGVMLFGRDYDYWFEKYKYN